MQMSSLDFFDIVNRISIDKGGHNAHANVFIRLFCHCKSHQLYPYLLILTLINYKKFHSLSLSLHMFQMPYE